MEVVSELKKQLECCVEMLRMMSDDDKVEAMTHIRAVLSEFDRQVEKVDFDEESGDVKTDKASTKSEYIEPPLKQELYDEQDSSKGLKEEGEIKEDTEYFEYGDSVGDDVKHSLLDVSLTQDLSLSCSPSSNHSASGSSIAPVRHVGESMDQDLDIVDNGKNFNSLYFHMDDIDDIIEENIKEVSAAQPGSASLPENIACEVKDQLSAKLFNPCQVMICRLGPLNDHYLGDLNDQQDPTVNDDEPPGPTPTIALVYPHHSTLSLFQKGFLGSFHCLREGCIYVCGTYGASTQKLLLNHWAKEHGDVKQLLYLDMSTNTVIGLKIIFNHVGSCSYVGCTHMLYGDTVDKFQAFILEHWHTSHPTMDNSYHHRMCQVISEEDIPTVTDQHIADLVRKQGILNGFRSGYRVSNHWLQDSVEYPFTCSAPGCGVLIKSMYGRHFSKLHTELPLDKIRVTTLDGKIITCEDLFNFALECGLCPKVCAGGGTKKHSRNCMKRHWQKDHPDRAKEEPIFRNIISDSTRNKKRPSICTTSSLNKKQKTAEN